MVGGMFSRITREQQRENGSNIYGSLGALEVYNRRKEDIGRWDVMFQGRIDKADTVPHRLEC